MIPTELEESLKERLRAGAVDGRIYSAMGEWAEKLRKEGPLTVGTLTAGRNLHQIDPISFWRMAYTLDDALVGMSLEEHQRKALLLGWNGEDEETDRNSWEGFWSLGRDLRNWCQGTLGLLEINEHNAYYLERVDLVPMNERAHRAQAVIKQITEGDYGSFCHGHETFTLKLLNAILAGSHVSMDDDDCFAHQKQARLYVNGLCGGDRGQGCKWGKRHWIWGYLWDGHKQDL